MTASNGPSTLRRRTVLSTAGVSALGALAGCLSVFSEDDPASVGDPDAADGDGDESEETDENGDGPLTDYQYTAPPQIVDIAEQGDESTVRTVPARHELVTEDGSGGPVELLEVWAWQADDLAPSVPDPIYRMSERDSFELTYDNSEHNRPR
ncbi:putative copper-containing oxidoreductase [Natrialba magadii ATCC 43099]|uniref:Copper-containing oxidoreductase n=1 Tax=Natrialba magadii (strain ATCC 43099 / DSM 3394 / CCM 3739 / CIP 104546 / IAM 13178 / JCM 8861 / NBRC 102185 / NCIMB 2190 / MS3) TaxID=547559 RepID=D3SUI2_NATMM|nr:hypothetical protein [Natrialba magadii]ADD05240.1 putative copper-containing oxidoreductase [Natrialba magadii ATCC 43099]ELY29037.1 multicopper oxidase type 3 [Natrialba magadii ATCC 43099]